MPIQDPEKRRAANAARMRRRRAEGTSWEDPAKEAARKVRWYHEQGGKERQMASNRERLQRQREQGLANFTRKLTEG